MSAGERGATSAERSSGGGSATHYHRHPTPGMPAAGEPFYHERQDGEGGAVKRALNNFLGGEAFSDESVAESVRNVRVQQLREQIRAQPEATAAQLGTTVAGGLTADQIATQAQTIAEQVADASFGLVRQGSDSLAEILRTDDNIGWAMDALRDRAAELGLPELRVQQINDSSPLRATGKLGRMENESDRMLVEERRIVDQEATNQLLVFRKNAEGEWFRLDDDQGQQLPQSPSEYVWTNPLRVADNERGLYTCMTLAGDNIVPRISPHAKPEPGAMMRV